MSLWEKLDHEHFAEVNIGNPFLVLQKICEYCENVSRIVEKFVMSLKIHLGQFIKSTIKRTHCFLFGIRAAILRVGPALLNCPKRLANFVTGNYGLWRLLSITNTFVTENKRPAP
jgi:hypothetical protein